MCNQKRNQSVTVTIYLRYGYEVTGRRFQGNLKRKKDHGKKKISIN